jgi:hypothetical protein
LSSQLLTDAHLEPASAIVVGNTARATEAVKFARASPGFIAAGAVVNVITAVIVAVMVPMMVAVMVIFVGVG